MKKYQTFTFLWLAVTAAISLVIQAGCANNGSVVGESQNTATSVKSNDPCRQGPITRKSAKENFFIVKPLPKSLSAAQCISICKQEFTKRKTRTWKFSPLVTIERIKVSNCNVEYYPHLPREASSDPKGGLRCDVDYTATYSPYTCPRILPPRRRPNQ